ncbi:MAG TPA: alpha/beta fold hydrolase [Terriglobales bacterium]|nr:alpha/beta fold hydrolase [Terriglobales bacterium]
MTHHRSLQENSQRLSPPAILLTVALVVIVLLLAIVFVRVRADTTTHINVAGRDVAMWKPAGPAPVSGYPVILFSHGFTGCNTQTVFLMEALAQDGYLVLAPNHRDARCGTAHGTSSGPLHPEEPFGKANLWSDATYRDRRKDMEVLLDAVLKDNSFEGVPVDPNRIGLAGHSLGGYTVLGLAGGWSSWKDPRIKAVLALSPYCTPYVQKGDLSDMKIPVMFQGGTLDFGITPTVRRLNGAYDHSSAPKIYVEFRGAGHFAWTDLNPRFQKVIDEYSLAFFDRYLKHADPDPLAPFLDGRKPGAVSFLRTDLQ